MPTRYDNAYARYLRLFNRIGVYFQRNKERLWPRAEFSGCGTRVRQILTFPINKSVSYFLDKFNAKFTLWKLWSNYSFFAFHQKICLVLFFTFTALSFPPIQEMCYVRSTNRDKKYRQNQGEAISWRIVLTVPGTNKGGTNRSDLPCSSRCPLHQ